MTSQIYLRYNTTSDTYSIISNRANSTISYSAKTSSAIPFTSQKALDVLSAPFSIDQSNRVVKVWEPITSSTHKHTSVDALSLIDLERMDKIIDETVNAFISIKGPVAHERELIDTRLLTTQERLKATPADYHFCYYARPRSSISPLSPAQMRIVEEMYGLSSSLYKKSVSNEWVAEILSAVESSTTDLTHFWNASTYPKELNGVKSSWETHMRISCRLKLEKCRNEFEVEKGIKLQAMQEQLIEEVSARLSNDKQRSILKNWVNHSPDDQELEKYKRIKIQEATPDELDLKNAAQQFALLRMNCLSFVKRLEQRHQRNLIRIILRSDKEFWKQPAHTNLINDILTYRKTFLDVSQRDAMKEVLSLLNEYQQHTAMRFERLLSVHECFLKGYEILFKSLPLEERPKLVEKVKVLFNDKELLGSGTYRNMQGSHADGVKEHCKTSAKTTYIKVAKLLEEPGEKALTGQFAMVEAHTVPFPGLFCPKLNFEASFGCSDTKLRNIRIKRDLFSLKDSDFQPCLTEEIAMLQARYKNVINDDFIQDAIFLITRLPLILASETEHLIKLFNDWDCLSETHISKGKDKSCFKTLIREGLQDLIVDVEAGRAIDKKTIFNRLHKYFESTQTFLKSHHEALTSEPKTPLNRMQLCGLHSIQDSVQQAFLKYSPS